ADVHRRPRVQLVVRPRAGERAERRLLANRRNRPAPAHVGAGLFRRLWVALDTSPSRRLTHAVPTRLLIRNGIVLPCAGTKRVFDPGSVLVEGNAVAAVGPVDVVDAQAGGAEILDASNHAV